MTQVPGLFILGAQCMPTLLQCYWILAAGAVIVTLLPTCPLPNAFKDAVRLSAARGKLWDNRPQNLGWLNDKSVPQQWFLHFYMIGTACCVTLLAMSSAAIMQKEAAFSTPLAACQYLALWLFTAHLIRRLLETWLIMKYPKGACMHIIAYLFGCSYYLIAPLSLMPAVFWSVNTSSPKALLFWLARTGLPATSTEYQNASTTDGDESGESSESPSLAAVAQLAEASSTIAKSIAEVTNALGSSASAVGIAASFVLGDGAAGAAAAVSQAASGATAVAGTVQAVAGNTHVLMKAANAIADATMQHLSNEEDGAVLEHAPRQHLLLKGITACTVHAKEATTWLWSTGHWVPLVGASIMVVGFIIQSHTHLLLAQLTSRNQGRVTSSNGNAKQQQQRQQQQQNTGQQLSYSIPHGGLFGLVSCPHYFGEVLIYLGLAVLCWPLLNPQLMLLWVVVNLVLAAQATQQWYHTHLPGYPKHRRALIPWVF